MRPSMLKPGQPLMVICPLGAELRERLVYFVRREPARGKGQPAKCFLRFPDYAGLDGPDDVGTCQISDYELSRRARYPEELRHVS